VRFTRRRELYFRVHSTHHTDPFFFVFVLWHVCCCCLSAFSSTTARCTCVAFWTTTGSTWSGRPGSHATTRRAAAPSSGAGKSAGSSAKSSPKRRAKVPVCRSPKRRAKEYSKVMVGVVCCLLSVHSRYLLVFYHGLRICREGTVLFLFGRQNHRSRDFSRLITRTHGQN
jgi:hypothetical protein